MRRVFQNIEAVNRGYHGFLLEETECRDHLRGQVKDNLIDASERNDSLGVIRALAAETGFKANDDLLADIQSLENLQLESPEFRIGEAYAEIILELEFSCRFHWNENRDARNPKGNKTGADLVGFIEIEGQSLFLFGEVKTSSEIAIRPPQVMTGAHGMEGQLRDLYSDPKKRFDLISYLKNKARLFPDGHPFKNDFDSSFKAYYSNDYGYQLVGVLIRDVESDERDISLTYNRLRTSILEPKGIHLLALYLPIPKENWLAIINESLE